MLALSGEVIDAPCLHHQHGCEIHARKYIEISKKFYSNKRREYINRRGSCHGLVASASKCLQTQNNFSQIKGEDILIEVYHVMD